MTRIVIWSTGAVGQLCLRAAHARDDLDIVGVWVHSEAKVGRDAGELVGIGPIGVITTGSIDEVIASRPDCVVYTASGPDLDATNMPVYVALLSAGINVVTVSSPGLMFPAAWDPAHVASLEAAAATGGATIYASGVEPGFVGDQLVALLATASETITSIRTQEIFRYDTYANEFLMFDVFGFGLPLDATPLMQLAGSQLHAWGPPVQYVAHALGVTLDEVRETYERRETPRDLQVAAGLIAAGTCGAVRMETIGVVGGREAIVIEHINRMAPDLAPDWPDADRDGTYRIVIEGSPSMTCELTFGGPDDASEHGMVATAMRILNAAPYVVAAPPGLTSSLDLPLTLPRNALTG
ncbi:MAG: diacylglycerol kinase [Nocardioides sp.]